MLDSCNKPGNVHRSRYGVYNPCSFSKEEYELKYVGDLWPMASVQTTSVAYKNRLLLYRMVALSKGTTGVDGMLVVEATADGIAFNDLVAHCSSVQVHADRSKDAGCAKESGEDGEFSPIMQLKSDVNRS